MWEPVCVNVMKRCLLFCEEQRRGSQKGPSFPGQGPILASGTIPHAPSISALVTWTEVGGVRLTSFPVINLHSGDQTRGLSSFWVLGLLRPYPGPWQGSQIPAGPTPPFDR